MRASQKDLEDLGSERETREQQVGYLLKVIRQFEEVLAQALGSYYSADDVFDEDEDLRLATVVVNRDITFAEDVARWGHEYSFGDSQDGDTSQDEYDGEYDGEYEENAEDQISTRKKDSISELQDVLHDSEDVPGSLNQRILAWIQESYRRSRGFELGTFNTSLLANLMRKQSRKWEPLALGYVSDVIVMVHEFIVKALKLSCHDDRVYRGLLSYVMEELLDKYRKASNQVEFLLTTERRGMMKTLNHYFNENLQKWCVY